MHAHQLRRAGLAAMCSLPDLSRFPDWTFSTPRMKRRWDPRGVEMEMDIEPAEDRKENDKLGIGIDLDASLWFLQTIWIWFTYSRSILSESGKRRLLWYCGDIFKGMMRLDGDGVCWQWIFPSQCLLPSLFHPASQCPSLLFHPHISHNVQASYPILISPHQEGNPASKLVRFGVFLWIFSTSTLRLLTI